MKLKCEFMYKNGDSSAKYEFSQINTMYVEAKSAYTCRS